MIEWGERREEAVRLGAGEVHETPGILVGGFGEQTTLSGGNSL